ncbi:DUF6284 family protein [Luedemannella helvata]|uniref:Uncharacterized protein n=1 Tax=Luedemannella helvata TaxID=349315 RepID=A0ABN2LA26_9ACTN
MIINLMSDDDGPTPADLAAIEHEWPLIAAEMDLAAAEIAVLCADRPLTELDWRRLRRAEQRVSREAAAFYSAAADVERRAA